MIQVVYHYQVIVLLHSSPYILRILSPALQIDHTRLMRKYFCQLKHIDSHFTTLLSEHVCGLCLDKVLISVNKLNRKCAWKHCNNFFSLVWKIY